jgi:hypothetical protein
MISDFGRQRLYAGNLPQQAACIHHRLARLQIGIGTLVDDDLVGEGVAAGVQVSASCGSIAARGLDGIQAAQLVQLTLHGFQPGQPGGHFQLAGAQLVVFAFEVGLTVK